MTSLGFMATLRYLDVVRCMSCVWEARRTGGGTGKGEGEVLGGAGGRVGSGGRGGKGEWVGGGGEERVRRDRRAKESVWYRG